MKFIVYSASLTQTHQLHTNRHINNNYMAQFLNYN